VGPRSQQQSPTKPRPSRTRCEGARTRPRSPRSEPDHEPIAPGLLDHRPGANGLERSPARLFAELQAGDERARDEIAAMYMPLAKRLAQRYVRSSEPREDLVQVACVGLVKAIERFDPARGPTFASFAIPTILGELRRYFRDATWAVHVPRGAQERAFAIEAAQEQLRSSRRSAPTVEQIADYLQLSEEEVLDGLLAVKAYETDSLDAPSAGGDDEGRSALELIGEEDGTYELLEADASITPAIRRLAERDRRVLHLRFVGDMSQSQIAARIGVSQMQVSRILARSLKELREMAGAAG
jgi:RNA polymerase sigma-B factor